MPEQRTRSAHCLLTFEDISPVIPFLLRAVWDTGVYWGGLLTRDNSECLDACVLKTSSYEGRLIFRRALWAWHL
jgi:hypothetical protein